MASRFLMPKGSDTMTEGKVLKWLKHEGEPVQNGDALVEIETDKVNMEVEAMASGILRKILVEEGGVVPVGELLAVIGKPEEDISSLIRADARPAKAPTATAPPESQPATAPQAAVAQPAPPAATGGRVLASPLARRMAKDAGLDLARVPGSGPGGRIVRRDVEGIVAAGGPRRTPTITLPPLTGPDYRDEPLSMMRKTIAQRLVQSLGPVPHFYLTIEVDMHRAKELRESANLLDPDWKLTYNDIILKAVAAALHQHPEVNASFMGDSIRYHNRIHIGMAVAVEGGGLMTPVLRDCDRKSLKQISAEAKDLGARARVRKLKPDEYAGGTFSVSNLGMMGVDEFSAVINPPEGAILAVGAVVEKPVAVDGRVEVGTRCRLTLSSDHRVVDGATGAAFLQTLRGILENPVYLAF